MCVGHFTYALDSETELLDSFSFALIGFLIFGGDHIIATTFTYSIQLIHTMRHWMRTRPMNGNYELVDITIKINKPV